MPCQVLLRKEPKLILNYQGSMSWTTRVMGLKLQAAMIWKEVPRRVSESVNIPAVFLGALELPYKALEERMKIDKLLRVL
jgi:hypothetical protein